jgi:ClpX C4-type zinc finger protein
MHVTKLQALIREEIQIMFGRKLLRCSFCGKDETQVLKLVAGPRVFICERCTAAAVRIIDGSNDSTLPPAPQTAVSSSVLTRAWHWLRGQSLNRMDEVGEVV